MVHVSLSYFIGHNGHVVDVLTSLHYGYANFNHLICFFNKLKQIVSYYSIILFTMDIVEHKDEMVEFSLYFIANLHDPAPITLSRSILSFEACWEKLTPYH